MMKSCAKRGPTFKPLTTKETLYFLLKKLQDKESQVSAMRKMIEERDEKITNHEKYIGALVDKMRELESGEHTKKRISRGTQTRPDASGWKRQSWYDAKKSMPGLQNVQIPPAEVNPYATLPRKRMGKRNRTEIVTRGDRNFNNSERSLISEESTPNSSTTNLNSLTIRLLRNELSRVWKEMRNLESRIRDSIQLKERRIKNAANEIDSGRQKLRTNTAQLREIHELPEETSQAEKIGRLEDTVKFLHQEVKYKASEVFVIEEGIRELDEVCILIQNMSNVAKQTLEMDPEIFEGKVVYH
eukprot:gene575-10263_t